MMTGTKADTPGILDVDFALTNLYFDHQPQTSLLGAIVMCNEGVYYPRDEKRRAQILKVRGLVKHIVADANSERFAFLFRMEAQKEHGSDRISPDENTLLQGLLESVRFGWCARAIPAGVYDHFKGGVYKLNKVTPCGERVVDGPPELEIVDYISLTYGTDHTRFLHKWQEVVQWPDGKFRSRYVFRGPDLKTEPPSFKVPRDL